MLSKEDNERLTRTGADTPMGQYFRRFWQPVALEEELPEPDGPPIRITAMGEELVAFRDTDGRLGLLDAHCPHRGANLFFGRNEDCGLRCVYHGWKFDVGGKAVDLPNIPPGARHHESIHAKAYPTRARGEIIWAYMGPPAETLPDGRLPELPQLEFGALPAANRYVTKQYVDCNWAQIMEGDLDTSHFSFLHMPAPGVASNENPDAPADARRLRWIRNDPMPKFTVLAHDAGFVVGGVRAADDGQNYWRITQYTLPAHGTGPSTFPGETYFGFTLVPITDQSCWMYCYGWNPERPIEGEERARLHEGHGIIANTGADYVPLQNRGNDYLIDRDAQRNSTFTGIKGLAEQDLMIQESQGRIFDRTRETLTATDAAVVSFRRTVLDGANALAESGIEPAAPWQHEAYRVRPGSWFAGNDVGFEGVMLQRFDDPLGRIG
jgi:phthalate 4,5-dioxygenase oxygenase subunit